MMTLETNPVVSRTYLEEKMKVNRKVSAQTMSILNIHDSLQTHFLLHL